MKIKAKQRVVRRGKQRGFWAAAIPAIASVAGAMMANDSNEGINNAQEQFNSAEAAKNRDFQKTMRETQYQTTVNDLKAAGLNPMLAYSNGGAGTPQGSTAQSGGKIAMQNAVAPAMNSALAAAQIEQTQAQTDATKALADKTRAEIPQVNANTDNLVKQLGKMDFEIEELRSRSSKQGQEQLTEIQRGQLTEAQKDLAIIQQRLTSGQIDNIQAQTQTQRIVTQLKRLEIPGAQNIADFENLTATGGGGGHGAIGALKGGVQVIRGIKR